MTEWREVELGDIAKVSWGDTSTTKASYVESGYPAYSASGPDGYLPHADHRADGVVISAIGAKCGKTWFAKGAWSCIKNTMWLRGGPDADTRFLFYATADPSQWPRRGAAQPFIGLGDAKRMRIRLPPLTAQRRIAALLGALDDLVENNRRRVEVLEEMARAIYREWFVHFRYPGHENATHVDSVLGPIPEGWEVGRVDSHFLLQRGFDLPTAEREPGPVPVIGASGRQGTHSIAKVQGPGLTAGRSGTVGAVTYVPGDFWPLNTSLWVKEFRLSTPRSAYFLLSSLDLVQAASGAAVPTLNRNVVHALPAACPPRALIEEWDAVALPVFESMERLRLQTERLAEIRDLLLPRLVTGQIDMSSLDLDTLVEDSVA